MKFLIRPVKFEDAEFINSIRRQDGIRENMMGLISDRCINTETLLKRISNNDHMLVAEIEENGVKKVVGIANLSVNKSNRVRYSASIGIMIKREYQGKGIGRTLMENLIDLADNWLMLVRVELGVFTDNDKAINLYKSLGFVIEGEKKYAIIRNGKYENEYIMARYNNKIVEK